MIRPERAALYGENGLLGAIEAALPKRTRGEIRAAIRAGAAGVRPLLAELGKTGPRRTSAEGETARPPILVIAIDQAEELFRVEGRRGKRRAAWPHPRPHMRRSAGDDRSLRDSLGLYDALQHAKPLEGLPQSTLPLLPMPRAAYKDVIEGPARRFVTAGGRLAIEPQLTQRLLADIDRGGGSDALPLLAFTLEQLFIEYRRAGVLRLAKLRGIRRVERRDRRRGGARASRAPTPTRAFPASARRARRCCGAGLFPGSPASTRTPRAHVATSRGARIFPRKRAR